MKLKTGFFLILFSVSFTSSAQWEPTNGPSGGYVRNFIFDGSFIYAATGSGGIFASYDNGANWNPAVTGLTGSPVLSLCVYNDTLYAGNNATLILPETHAERNESGTQAGYAFLL